MSRAAGMRQISKMGFSPEWLDLREPADHAARDPALRSQALDGLAPGQVILDLGSGTGSTARAFQDLVPDQAWRFMDADESLLALAARRHRGSQQVARDLRAIDALPLDGVGLVTASALLDLMPLDWIAALARHLGQAGIPFYAALNYNGEMEWSPALPEDATITQAFNRHQLGDKGLGPAAGPHSVPEAKRAFEGQGFEVTVAESPWQLGPAQAALHDSLLAGIKTAAAEIGAEGTEAWYDSRRQMLSQSYVSIGHGDLLALPS